MQTEWHNKCTGWHGWSWQLPKQAWPGNVHQFTAFLLSISRSQGFSRDSNVKVTIIQRAFCFHCYLHLIMHSLSLTASWFFSAFRRGGVRAGTLKPHDKPQWQHRKPETFAGCIWMRWMHWIQTEEADWSRLSRKFWGLWIDGRVDCVDSVSTIDVEIESLSESLSSRLRRPGENSTKPRAGPARNQF
jgi:hypothetical protein